MTSNQLDRPTYGGWQRPATPGLRRLGTLGSAATLGAVIIAVLTEAFAGWQVALVWLACTAPLMLPLLYRDRAGRNGWQKVGTHAAWLIGRRQGQHVLIGARAGVLAFGSAKPPGLLAQSHLLESEDGYGKPFALVHVPQAQHCTVLIGVQPDGSALVDDDTVDNWVARHGLFLAALGHEPGLVGASFTVETAPDPGNRLTAEVHRLLTDEAPELSRRVLTEVAETYPRGAASVTGRIALTYTARRPKTDEAELLAVRGVGKAPRGARSDAEMAAHIGQRLPGILRQLAGTGVGTPEPMTARQVAETVRGAYDPASVDLIDAERAAGGDSQLDWPYAGPVGAHETWSAYRHDSGNSVTWEMVEAPRGVVYSKVLEDIVAPSDAVARKRVTILYRPHDPATSAAIADRDVRTAIMRATQRKGEGRAAEHVALDAARQTAREEAAGAGMVRFAMLVTATVTDPAKLPAAVEAVDQLGRASRLRLRRCYGAQAASFTAALGVGIVPAAHIAVPTFVKDWM